MGLRGAVPITRFGAVLRGVNPGGGTRVPTAFLQELLAREIAAKLGAEVSVLVKSAGELSAVVSENPLSAPDAEQPRPLVAFAPGSL